MILGKRARHPMKRTTSMTEFSFDDLSGLHPSQPSDQLPPYHPADRDHHHHHRNHHQNNTNHRLMAMVSPRPLHRRNSADFVLQSSRTFLTTCSLCNRRLAPGRDIYMYRGDSAYCSLECRQQQMAQDEWKEKEKMNNNNNQSDSSGGSHVSPSPPHVIPETLAAS